MSDTEEKPFLDAVEKFLHNLTDFILRQINTSLLLLFRQSRFFEMYSKNQPDLARPYSFLIVAIFIYIWSSKIPGYVMDFGTAQEVVQLDGFNSLIVLVIPIFLIAIFIFKAFSYLTLKGTTNEEKELLVYSIALFYICLSLWQSIKHLSSFVFNDDWRYRITSLIQFLETPVIPGHFSICFITLLPTMYFVWKCNSKKLLISRLGTRIGIFVMLILIPLTTTVLYNVYFDMKHNLVGQIGGYEASHLKGYISPLENKEGSRLTANGILINSSSKNLFLWNQTVKVELLENIPGSPYSALYTNKRINGRIRFPSKIQQLESLKNCEVTLLLDTVYREVDKYSFKLRLNVGYLNTHFRYQWIDTTMTYVTINQLSIVSKEPNN